MAPADRILAIGNHVAVEGESPLAMALTAGGTKPKLWDTTPAPNPRIVRMFMHEKGITNEIDVVQVNLAKMENRTPPYNEKINPAGQVPALELPDGTVIAEVTVICELLEDMFPNRGPNLIGKTPVERAITRMWCRRIDYKVAEFVFAGFRYAEGFKFFEPRMKLLPDAAPGMKMLAQEGTKFFDQHLTRTGNKFLQGNDCMLSDLWLYTVLHFGRSVKQPINPECKAVAEWMKRVEERASVKAVKG